MKRYFICAALAVLLLGTGSSFGAGQKPVADDDEASANPAMKSVDASRKDIAERRKTAAKIKLIDINSASAAELKKLPGIGDAEARKIVAGRPYGSKFWLVTNNILLEGTYSGIKDRIVARQPFKDGDKNAEIYKKLSEKKTAEELKAGGKQ
ncbi:MAG: hypothetical protein A3F73_14315 [Gallionellales bacterium RIFCSPLOWO2_12_FULL_59_22]|nr:MAG: hypothetical protein A3H99_07000 [Gallionellales bacterium RIFCSPLOWO2_02_FULL_59_110]OGT05602.1 MAG: hypothetical protein A2Z65_04210 [Gallionellales bacterium RIFCSPLOWO2_02_58_13]OGT14729.1 MAG: hypothetical protein A3F73_14315 [Gallionellales bacterium RIFCSPLOWO2_12_FULL_59_22]